MSKIIGVTVGTPLSADKLKEKIKPVTSVNGVKADASGNVEVKVTTSGGDMQKSAYDASGAVAAAGGIAAYVQQNGGGGGISMDEVEEYVSGVVGDIDSLLDDINGEVV